MWQFFIVSTNPAGMVIVFYYREREMRVRFRKGRRYGSGISTDHRKCSCTGGSFDYKGENGMKKDYVLVFKARNMTEKELTRMAVETRNVVNHVAEKKRTIIGIERKEGDK